MIGLGRWVRALLLGSFRVSSFSADGSSLVAVIFPVLPPDALALAAARVTERCAEV